MADYSTATYFFTNSAKFRGSILSNKQRKAMLLYCLTLIGDGQNSSSYAANLPLFRSAVVEPALKGAGTDDDPDFMLSAELAMTLGEVVGGAFGTNKTLAQLLDLSKQANEWDEPAIDRAILVARSRIWAS